MGITQVTAAVRNPAKPDTAWEALFLVDTGAVDCLVPGRHLRELGIEPRGKRIYELADGTEVTLEVGGAEKDAVTGYLESPLRHNEPIPPSTRETTVEAPARADCRSSLLEVKTGLERDGDDTTRDSSKSLC